MYVYQRVCQKSIPWFTHLYTSGPWCSHVFFLRPGTWSHKLNPWYKIIKSLLDKSWFSIFVWLVVVDNLSGEGPLQSKGEVVLCCVQQTVVRCYQLVSNLLKQTSLVGGFEPLLWQMMEWKSVGMMTFLIYGKIKQVPKHQPVVMLNHQKNNMIPGLFTSWERNLNTGHEDDFIYLGIIVFDGAQLQLHLCPAGWHAQNTEIWNK